MTDMKELTMRSHSGDQVDKRCRSDSDRDLTASAKKKKNDSSPDKLIPQNVSLWTRSTAEKLGIFYDIKAIDISEFLKISRDSPYFVYPLEDEHQKVLCSLVNATERKMHKTRNPSLSGTQTVQFVAEIEHCQDILDDLMQQSEDDESDPHILWYHRRSHYSLEIFIMQLQQICIRKKQGQRLAECDFTELFAKFTRIFLLNENVSFRKRSMRIGDVSVSGAPDLYFWARIPESSVATAAVTEEKLDLTKLMGETDSFVINMAVNDKVLGQHAGELLLELAESAFPNVSLGMICKQTAIIFTYLEMCPEHYTLIQENGATNVKVISNGKYSGKIHYTRPYDYLKETDRNEILEFLFWLGLHSLPRKYRPKVNKQKE